MESVCLLYFEQDEKGNVYYTAITLDHLIYSVSNSEPPFDGTVQSDLCHLGLPVLVVVPLPGGKTQENLIFTQIL